MCGSVMLQKRPWAPRPALRYQHRQPNLPCQIIYAHLLLPTRHPGSRILSHTTKTKSSRNRVAGAHRGSQPLISGLHSTTNFRNICPLAWIRINLAGRFQPARTLFGLFRVSTSCFFSSSMVCPESKHRLGLASKGERA